MCTGRVTKVHPRGFAAICRLRTGERRRVDARWQPSETADFTDGLITTTAF
jgi:hypothetical protein